MSTEANEHFCRVKYCRFPETHSTAAHQCGKCKEFGHGQVECDHDRLKTKLVQYHTEIIPTEYWCLLCPPNSDFRKTHTSASHVCRNCGERTTAHNEENCIIQEYEVFENRFFGIGDISSFELHLFEQHGDNIYTILNVGMGCCVYVRIKNGITKALFMHSDSWGQYGPASDDRPKLNKFIEGCIECDRLLFQPSLHPLPDSPVGIVQCPVCRTENSFDSIKVVFGCEEKCKICLENNVTKFFSDCGHLITCDECFESLSKN